MCDNVDLISKIKFISKIKQGEKVNTRGFFIQNDSLISKISRSFYYQDTRANTITFISDTLIQVFHLLKLYATTKRVSDISMCINVMEDITNMKKGISNLQKTYQDDAIIVSKLETFMQEIDSKLLEFKDTNSDISEKIKPFIGSLEMIPEITEKPDRLCDKVDQKPKSIKK